MSHFLDCILQLQDPIKQSQAIKDFVRQYEDVPEARAALIQAVANENYWILALRILREMVQTLSPSEIENMIAAATRASARKVGFVVGRFLRTNQQMQHFQFVASLLGRLEDLDIYLDLCVAICEEVPTKRRHLGVNPAALIQAARTPRQVNGLFRLLEMLFAYQLPEHYDVFTVLLHFVLETEVQASAVSFFKHIGSMWQIRTPHGGQYKLFSALVCMLAEIGFENMEYDALKEALSLLADWAEAAGPYFTPDDGRRISCYIQQLMWHQSPSVFKSVLLLIENVQGPHVPEYDLKELLSRCLFFMDKNSYSWLASGCSAAYDFQRMNQTEQFVAAEGVYNDEYLRERFLPDIFDAVFSCIRLINKTSCEWQQQALESAWNDLVFYAYSIPQNYAAVYRLLRAFQQSFDADARKRRVAALLAPETTALIPSAFEEHIELLKAPQSTEEAAQIIYFYVSFLQSAAGLVQKERVLWRLNDLLTQEDAVSAAFRSNDSEELVSQEKLRQVLNVLKELERGEMPEHAVIISMLQNKLGALCSSSPAQSKEYISQVVKALNQEAGALMAQIPPLLSPFSPVCRADMRAAVARIGNALNCVVLDSAIVADLGEVRRFCGTLLTRILPECRQSCVLQKHQIFGLPKAVVDSLIGNASQGQQIPGQLPEQAQSASLDEELNTEKAFSNDDQKYAAFLGDMLHALLDVILLMKGGPWLAEFLEKNLVGFYFLDRVASLVQKYFWVLQDQMSQIVVSLLGQFVFGFDKAASKSEGNELQGLDFSCVADVRSVKSTLRANHVCWLFQQLVRRTNQTTQIPAQLMADLLVISSKLKIKPYKLLAHMADSVELYASEPAILSTLLNLREFHSLANCVNHLLLYQEDHGAALICTGLDWSPDAFQQFVNCVNDATADAPDIEYYLSEFFNAKLATLAEQQRDNLQENCQ